MIFSSNMPENENLLIGHIIPLHYDLLPYDMHVTHVHDIISHNSVVAKKSDWQRIWTITGTYHIGCIFSQALNLPIQPKSQVKKTLVQWPLGRAPVKGQIVVYGTLKQHHAWCVGLSWQFSYTMAVTFSAATIQCRKSLNHLYMRGEACCVISIIKVTDMPNNLIQTAYMWITLWSLPTSLNIGMYVRIP